MSYNSRRNKKQKNFWGLIPSGIALVLVLLTFFDFATPFSNFILGIFGVLFYPIMLLVFLVGLAVCMNLRFSMSAKNITYLIITFVSLSLILHSAFLGSFAKEQGLKMTNYFNCICSVASFESGLTVGGALLTIFAYPFMCLLGVVGSSIVFAIVFCVFTCLTIDYYVNAKRAYDNAYSTRIRDRNSNIDPNAYIASKDSIGNSLSNLNKTSDVVPLKSEDEDYVGYLKPNEKIVNPYLTDEYGSVLSTETGEIINNFTDDNEEESTISESTLTSIYGKTQAEGFEDGNLSNNEKANSHYDPSKFKSQLEYITSPYSPSIYSSSSGNNSNLSNYDTEKAGELFGIDNITQEESSEEEILSQGNPFITDDPIDEENSLGSIIEENRKTASVSDSQNGFSSPFSPFGTGSPIEEEEETGFVSTANTFLNNKPKERLVQMPLPGVDVKPAKSYKQEQDRKYNAPPTTLLEQRSDDESTYGGDYKSRIVALERILQSFKLEAKVTNVVRGPSVTQYELEMPYGVSVKKILPYDDDITSALLSKSPVRIEAPILGKNAVGIEVANDKRSTVGLRELLESKEFQTSTANLPFVVGKTVTGEIVVKSLPKMVHMLVAGSTGSGKSVFLHSLILSLMFKSSPAQLRFIMIDPKRVEFTHYSGMPHMMLPNAINECDKAINALGWAVKEMDRRFKKLQKYNVQNIADFNHCSAVTETKEEEQMPYLVIVIDELADLMMVGKKEVEEKIMRLAQLGRASGIHMIIATQRPSTDIVTGTIKTNLPTRVALSLSSGVDSRVILDEVGAEKLLGQGDLLFAPQDSNAKTRIQAPFQDMGEMKRVVEYIKEHNESFFDSDVANEILADKKPENAGDATSYDTTNNYDPNNPDFDELLPVALKLCIDSGGASINMVQRRFRVGYARAARIIDQMELAGYISQGNGSKLRTVHMSLEEFREKFGDIN